MIFKNHKKNSLLHMSFFGSIRKQYFLYLTIFISTMLVFTIFGGRGLMQIYHLKEEREKIKIATGRLSEENRKLAQQIERMKKNKKEEVERIAREELGLVKKGEIIYKFE
ncbi:MAG: septum formation initiator family protein [Deltaproteobacteria bacterium]|jgi:cell division protein FtsB|nr:septum formation initiator family protein [Deltaproteobacteria bacterium]MDO9210114.1 septum formation initiator family protein [Deltaproteobacteria bacterium]